MIDVAPGTIVVYADIGCPWSHLVIHRLLATREEMVLHNEVVLVHRVFALELVNEEPTAKLTLYAEIPVLGALDPDAGWQMWQDDAWGCPSTVLPAREAV